MTPLTIRLPDDLAKDLREAAVVDHRSLNSEIIALLEDALATRANTHKLVNV